MNNSIQAKIFAERTALLYKNGPASSITVLMASSLFTVILWDEAQTEWLIAWFSGLSAITLVRIGLVVQYRKAFSKRPDPKPWMWRYAGATALIGFFWAMVVPLGFTGDLWIRMLIVILVTQLQSAAIPVLVSFPRLMMLYTLPSAGVLIWVLAARGGNEALLSIAIVIYTVLMVRSSYSLHHTLKHSLQLQFEKLELAENLSKEKVNAEKLNQTLQQEVVERKQVQQELEKNRQNLESQVLARTAELTQSMEAAEAGSRAKSEFLATMSHEIRTPMNGVLGMTELLRDSGLNGKQQQFAETAHRSGQALLDVINNILDFSKIEANKLKLVHEPFDLQEVVEDVLQMVAEQARENHLELLGDIPADINCKVIGDGPRLRQVLINLVGNAVKFTKQGEIVMSAALVKESSDEVLILFRIQDSGIGIDADKLAGIFGAFTQADGSITRQYGGTGLGLAISKQLVTLMGGEIGVESKKGEGSIFIFTVQFGKQTQIMPPVATSFDPVMGTRVLIVDDNMPTRSLLLKKIEGWGLQADDADNGDKALMLLQEAAADGKPYRLAILDRMMPGMDGITLARKIKADPATADTRLLMYSALHEEAGDTDWREAGIQAYLSKPARLKDLRHQVLSLLTDNISIMDQAEVFPAEAVNVVKIKQSGSRILLVEDNEVNQTVALNMLEKLGCRVDVAAQGHMAVESEKKNSYDLILMDCHMPEMDGFEATKTIRNQESDASHVPIIALTADVQKDTQEQCHAAGMDDYLSKPFEQKALRSVLEKWLPVKQTNATDDNPPVTPTQTENTLAQADGAGSLDQMALDKIRALQRPGAPDLLGKVIGIYLDTTPGLMEKIKDMAVTGDADNLHKAAHSLKSSSANLGAMQLSSICKDLEAIGREGKIQKAQPLIESLMVTTHPPTIQINKLAPIEA
ncbi:MAG: response regulator [gamma proteobacterium endosymbiont of Lamellibrachia anaximandri]|nr:response regulator [gamma proteobacterium endosymbiont of Lamellibrachia anaximandri]MBL3535718.1 response regulator [gamma proteobacterium endosymbiont of Lamellibrachia anaximandri]